ncbi:MAG: translocation/assembly module TamB domain-containing protein [Pseudomonadota bacterium]
MRRLTIATLVLAGLLAPPAAAQLSFLGLKNNLVQLLLDQISVPGEFEVTADEVIEPEDGSTALRGLAIADADGIWLRIGQVSLDWNATALLGGTVEIRRLAAQDVEYLRAPGAAVTVKEDEEPAEEDEAGFEWPRAPLTTIVEELRLERVRIAPGAIAEQGLAFDAVGSARDEGDDQALNLEVTRTDDVTGKILIDYLRTFDANTLALELEADEAAGGLVAEFAGLPATSASRASIDASGPLTDWQLELAIASDRVIDVNGALTVQLEGATNVVADLTIDPGEELSPTARRLLEPQATLALSVVEGEDGVIRIERGRVESPEVNLTAAGFYDTGSGAVDIDVDLTANPGLLADAEGTSFETMGLTARIDGDGTDLDADGELRVARFSSPSADIGLALLEARVTQRGERLEFAVDGDLDALRIDRLGPDVLGDGTLTARGSSEGSVFELAELRFTSQPLRIEAEGRADTAANTLGFDYLASAERIAPIAAAYDADATGALRLEGRVEGTPDVPQLTGTLALEGLGFEGEDYGAVRLTHQATIGEEPAGQIALTAEGSRFGPAELSSFFRLDGSDLALTSLALRALDAEVDGNVTVDLDTTLMTGEVVMAVPSLARTEAATGLALRGNADGRIILGTETLEQKFGTSREMQVADIAFAITDFAGFEAEVASLGIAGKLSDLLGQPGGDFTIALRDARHPAASIRSGQVQAVLQSLTRKGRADIRYRLEDITAPDQAALAVFEGSAILTDIDTSPDAAIDAVAREITIAAVEGGSVAEARVTANLQDLAGSPGGTVSAQIDAIRAAGYAVRGVTAETELADLTGAGSAKGSILAVGVDGPDAALATAAVDFDMTALTTSPEGRVSAEITELAAAGYSIERVTADTRLADLTGSASAEGTLSATSVSGAEAGLARAEVAFDMDDLAGDPQGTVDAVVTQLTAAGFSIDRVEADARLASLVSSPAVTLTASTSRIDGPGIAAAGATVEADLANLAAAGRGTASVTLNGLSGTAAARSVTLTADLSALTPPAGTVQLRTEGLSAAGAEIGAARLDARLTDRGGQTDVNATLSAPNIEAEGLAVGGFSLEAAIRDVLGRPGFDSRFRAESVEGDGLVLVGTELTVAGPLSNLAIALDASGELDQRDLVATLRARVDAEGPLEAEIATLSLRLGEAEAALDSPLRLRSRGSATAVEGLALTLPGGRITGDTTLYANGAAGTLALDFADLGRLKELAEASPVKRGSLRLDARFDTRRGSAGAEIDGQARNLAFDQAVAAIGDLGLDLTSRWDGRRIENDIALSGPFGDPFRVNAALGLVPSGGLAPRVPDDAGLDGTVRWEGDVGDLWVLVPLPDHVLDGRLLIDLALAGTIDTPQVDGRVEMREGQYQNLDAGTILTHLSLDTELQSTDTFTLVFSGRDGASGTVEGRLALSPRGLDASVKADSAVLVRRDDVTAQISTDIAVRGPLDSLDVTGRTLIERAEVRLINATPPSVATLGDVRIKGAPIEENGDGAGGTINLDLSVEAPRDVFVRGRGLDSEWRIDLDITGTAAQPRMVGSVERIRGILDLLGRRFDLTEGEVQFTGGRTIDPRLTVTLAHENAGVTGFINVRGNASDPQISFTSEPSLPEEEVLPRTVFGQSSQSLSPSQAIQLGAAVTTLLDGSGGTFDDIRSAVGVDVLRFDTDAEGAAEVTVGKNVADGVFVGATQPVAGGESKVTVEVEIFDNVTVDGEVGSEGSTSVGVNWRKDF